MNEIHTHNEDGVNIQKFFPGGRLLLAPLGTSQDELTLGPFCDDCGHVPEQPNATDIEGATRLYVPLSVQCITPGSSIPVSLWPQSPIADEIRVTRIEKLEGNDSFGDRIRIHSDRGSFEAYRTAFRHDEENKIIPGSEIRLPHDVSAYGQTRNQILWRLGRLLGYNKNKD